MNSQDEENDSSFERESLEEDLDSEIARYNLVLVPAEKRAEKIEAELAVALEHYITLTEARLIDISSLTPEALGKILFEHPHILNLCSPFLQ